MTSTNLIHKKIRDRHHEDWGKYIKNIYQTIKPRPELNTGTLFPGTNRHEKTVLAHVRIGHTKMTHKHLLISESQPTCKCKETSTINHILNNCKLLTNYCHFYFGNCN